MSLDNRKTERGLCLVERLPQYVFEPPQHATTLPSLEQMNWEKYRAFEKIYFEMAYKLEEQSRVISSLEADKRNLTRLLHSLEALHTRTHEMLESVQRQAFNFKKHVFQWFALTDPQQNVSGNEALMRKNLKQHILDAACEVEK